MELPHLGSRCSVSDCKQLDFLPFTCPSCGSDFCNDHRQAEDHACRGAADFVRETPLPVCVYPCSAVDCSEASHVEMKCTACTQHYCLKHRHHGCLDQTYTESEKRRWEEPKRSFAAAKAQVDKEVEAALKSARQKASKTALKVQLMRLKSKAVGRKTVPLEDRAYFFVNPPASTGQLGKAVYVSVQWPVGRVVDALADALCVVNENNKLGAARLGLMCDGVEVCADMSQTLKKLIESNKIVEGETVSLEFISKTL